MTVGKKPDSKMKKKIPFIDIADCTDCESCISLRPDIFKRNKETGLIDVVDLGEYPEEEIEEIMSLCPGKCIRWQQD